MFRLPGMSRGTSWRITIWERRTCKKGMRARRSGSCAAPSTSIRCTQRRNLGLSYLQQEQFESAVDALEKGLEADPAHYETLDNLGTYYLNTEDEPGAIVMLQRALTVRPDAHETRAKLALAHFRADDMVNARLEAERVLERDPGNELARQILGAL